MDKHKEDQLNFSFISAFASASFENNNTFTIVYSNDHVITRSVGSAKISYGYAGFWKKELLFSTTHNKSDQRSEFLTISGEYLPNGKNKDANLTFAIQSLTPTDENEPIQEKRFCVQNSSPSLKKMIKACDRQLTLRELVADEEKQMKQFQDRVKGKTTAFLFASLPKTLSIESLYNQKLLSFQRSKSNGETYLRPGTNQG